MQTLSTQDYRTLPTSALVRAVLGRLTSDAHSVASSIPSPSTGGRGAGTATGAGAGAGIGAGGGGVTSSRRRRQRRRSARGTDTIPDVVQLASSDDDDYHDGASSAASSSTFEDSDEEQVRVPLRGHTGGAGGAAGAAAGGTGHYWGHRRRAPPGASNNNNSMQQLGGRRQTADAGQFVSSRDRRGGHRAHSEIESDDGDGVDDDDDDADLHHATMPARGDASSLTSMWLHTDSEMVLGTINESTKSSGDFWWPLEDMVNATTTAFTTYPHSPLTKLCRTLAPQTEYSTTGPGASVDLHTVAVVTSVPSVPSAKLRAMRTLLAKYFLFAALEPVKSVFIPMQPGSDLTKPIAFVEFTSETALDNAVKATTETSLNGWQLHVSRLHTRILPYIYFCLSPQPGTAYCFSHTPSQPTPSSPWCPAVKPRLILLPLPLPLPVVVRVVAQMGDRPHLQLALGARCRRRELGQLTLLLLLLRPPSQWRMDEEEGEHRRALRQAMCWLGRLATKQRTRLVQYSTAPNSVAPLESVTSLGSLHFVSCLPSSLHSIEASRTPPARRRQAERAPCGQKFVPQAR